MCGIVHFGRGYVTIENQVWVTNPQRVGIELLSQLTKTIKHQQQNNNIKATTTKQQQQNNNNKTITTNNNNKTTTTTKLDIQQRRHL